MHAFGLLDRALGIVAEFPTFNQYGSDHSMIFFFFFLVNANTIL